MARDALAYLNTRVLLKSLGQLELLTIAGRDDHLKRPRRDREEKLINLIIVAIRELLDAYHKAFRIILPTVGMVSDMGRTMTHKKIVIDMALSRMSTKEIGRRIYHIEEAVDSFIRTLIRILLLRYYNVPEAAIIHRVTLAPVGAG